MAGPTSEVGWIKIHRKLLDWEWYTDWSTTGLFLHLLLTAQWDDTRYRGMAIKRGQRLVSLRSLSEETKLSFQKTRTSIERLKSTHEITQKITHLGSLYTVVKYDEYQQRNAAVTQQTTRDLTTEQHSINTPIDKERKEGKEERNIRTPAPGFEFVHLSPSDREQLLMNMTENELQACIEYLNSWIGSVPNKKRRANGENARHTIQLWVIKAIREQAGEQPRNYAAELQALIDEEEHGIN